MFSAFFRPVWDDRRNYSNFPFLDKIMIVYCVTGKIFNFIIHIFFMFSKMGLQGTLTDGEILKASRGTAK